MLLKNVMVRSSGSKLSTSSLGAEVQFAVRMASKVEECSEAVERGGVFSREASGEGVGGEVVPETVDETVSFSITGRSTSLFCANGESCGNGSGEEVEDMCGPMLLISGIGGEGKEADMDLSDDTESLRVGWDFWINKKII